VEQGADTWTAQDGRLATYAPKLEKGELDLDPLDGVERTARKVQASSEAHPARCVLAGRGVTVLAGRPAGGGAAHAAERLAPGRAARWAGAGVRCSAGARRGGRPPRRRRGSPPAARAFSPSGCFFAVRPAHMRARS